jgi:hypothetical protein
VNPLLVGSIPTRRLKIEGVTCMKRDVAIIIITCCVLIFGIGATTSYDIIPRGIGIAAGTIVSGVTVAYIIKHIV